MKKIAFIGAGSFIFTRNLVTDILTFPAFADCEIALVDINEHRLEKMKKVVERIVKDGNYGAKVTSTTNRVEALKGADGVLSTIFAGGVNVWRHDVEIPAKYGVDINVGDTRGPSAVFRALRTIPIMLDICKDIEIYCPNAVFLNYTNPMAILCRAMQGVSKVNVTGLCHSVQSTVGLFAKWINAPVEEITYLCAGINHQAWYLDLKWNGKDIYPLIRKAMEDPAIYNEEKVRNEMFRHFGYYVTESSGHNSEYNPWFRKRPELIKKYCSYEEGYTGPKSWNPGDHLYTLKKYLKRELEGTWDTELDKWMEQETINLERGKEYAAHIFNAIFGDGSLYKFNGNVRNFGLIDNLPEGCCVEVPVLASPRGLEPIHVGSLPSHLAILNNINARCEELAVEAALEGDPQKVFYSICHDPLTSAVLSLEEIKDMVNEMFAANRDWLPQFKQLKV